MEVSLHDVAVFYGERRAVLAEELSVRSGGFLCLIGPNGSGKTSLLRGVGGLVPFSGEVLFGSRPAPPRRRVLARLVSYVPQRPVLPEAMTVNEYVLLGRTPHISFLGTESRHDRQVAASVLARLELSDLADRPLGSLSGGESQRAVLGRALAQQAPVLLLDEPTAALDIGHGQQVMELVDELRLSDGLTVVAAMHDLTLAGQFAEQLALLARGRLIERGPVDRVLTEQTLALHYGAELRVIDDGAGNPVVLPRRRRRSRAPGPAAENGSGPLGAPPGG